MKSKEMAGTFKALNLFLFVFVFFSTCSVFAQQTFDQAINAWIKESETKLPPHLRSIPALYRSENPKEGYDPTYTHWEKNPSPDELKKGGIPLEVKPWKTQPPIKLLGVHSFTLEGRFLVIVQYGNADGPGLSDLYIQESSKFKRLLDVETIGDIDLIKPGGKVPVFIRVDNNAGGSGYTDEFFLLQKDGSLKSVLSLWCWQGGYKFFDIDGDGSPVIVHSLACNFYPKELEKGLKKLNLYVEPEGPIMQMIDIQKWNGKGYEEIGDYYGPRD